MTILLTALLLGVFLLNGSQSSSSSFAKQSSLPYSATAFANALDNNNNHNNNHNNNDNNNNGEDTNRKRKKKNNPIAQQQQQKQQQQQQQQQREDDAFSPPRHMQTHPLLQIPCGLSLESQTHPISPVAAFVDTGAQVSVLSYQAVQKSGLIPLLDRRYAGHALGVGHCRVLGRIPAGAVVLIVDGHRIPAPSLTILESTNEGVDLLLGLDFLRDYQATLSLREEEMIITVRNQDIQVPFIRPRSSLSFGKEGTGDNNDDDADCLTAKRLCGDSDGDGTDADDGCLDMSGV